MIILIYLIGCVVAYPVFKYSVQKLNNEDEWTQMLRVITIVISLFSWLTVIAAPIIVFTVLGIAKLIGDDKPAKW